MSTSLKIQQPKFIDELEQVDDLYEEITLAEKIQNKIIENDLLEDKDTYSLTIDSCKFKNIVFSNYVLPNIDLIDTVLRTVTYQILISLEEVSIEWNLLIAN